MFKHKEEGGFSISAMLVVSLWGVNYRIWSHLGCLEWKVTIFAHSGIA